MKSNDYVYVFEFVFLKFSDSSLMRKRVRKTHTHTPQRNLNQSKILYELNQLCLIGLATSNIKSPMSALLALTPNNYVPEKE